MEHTSLHLNSLNLMIMFFGLTTYEFTEQQAIEHKLNLNNKPLKYVRFIVAFYLPLNNELLLD